MGDVTISELRLPATVDDGSPEAGDFAAFCALDNLVFEQILGGKDFEQQAAERLPTMRDPELSIGAWVAKDGDRVIGIAQYYAQRGEALEADVAVTVHPDHRRRGIATALLAAIEDRAREENRSVLTAHIVASASIEPPRIAAASGYGDLPAADSGPAFALAQGFRLEQVGRLSHLPLPVAEEVLVEREAHARRHFEADYELVHWVGRTPEEYLADLGVLITRMSTDQPHAEVQQTEDVWDADRVRANDERRETGPRVVYTAAARHLASGRLVAFTQLAVAPSLERPVGQWATLVLDEHRGHRLGLAVKLENLRQLQLGSPGRPSVVTVNAEENEYMISVNESMGFRAVGRGGIFQREID